VYYKYDWNWFIESCDFTILKILKIVYSRAILIILFQILNSAMNGLSFPGENRSIKLKWSEELYFSIIFIKIIRLSESDDLTCWLTKIRSGVTLSEIQLLRVLSLVIMTQFLRHDFHSKSELCRKVMCDLSWSRISDIQYFYFRTLTTVWYYELLCSQMYVFWF